MAGSVDSRDPEKKKVSALGRKGSDDVFFFHPPSSFSSSPNENGPLSRVERLLWTAGRRQVDTVSVMTETRHPLSLSPDYEEASGSDIPGGLIHIWHLP